MELNLNQEQIKCTSRVGEPLVCRVVVTETKVIPAGHEAMVAGAVYRSEGLAGPMIVEPVEGGGELAQRGLVLARALIEAPTEVVPVRVLNPCKEKRVLRAGTTVGRVLPVKVENRQTSRVEEDGRDLPAHLNDLFQRSKVNLGAAHHTEVLRCLAEFQDVFLVN